MIYIPERLKNATITQAEINRERVQITWAAHLRAYAVYSDIYGKDQSAERIAERGGFGTQELDVFYPEWRNHIIKSDKG